MIKGAPYNIIIIVNKMIANKLRRSFLQRASADTTATRSFFQFNYPHSFEGINNAFNKTPQNNKYPGYVTLIYINKGSENQEILT